MRPPATKRTLFFMHVPKTGGTSLDRVLTNRFAPEERLAVYSGVEPGMGALERHRYIAGHITADVLGRFSRPRFVITVLRDPVERGISAYSYLRSFPLEREAAQLSAALAPAVYERWVAAFMLARGYSIDEFIRRDPELGRRQFGNRHARALGGARSGGGEERLDAALQGLERCDLIGLTERLDESAVWLARRLGWRELGPLPSDNPSAERLRREDLAAEDLDALVRLTSVDRALYAHAVRRYEQQLDRWSEAPDPRDRSAAIDDAPAVADLRFDDPIPGSGWAVRERDGDGRSFCWIGETRSAWVDLAASRRARSVVVEIPHAIDPAILETLQIWVNDEPAPVRLAESGNGAVIARASLKRRSGHPQRGGALRVRLEVGRSARPCDVEPTSDDDRELAIAVRRVALTR